MKTLFILKKDPGATITAIMKEREKESELIVIDLREVKDYDLLVDTIERCGQVMTW